MPQSDHHPNGLNADQIEQIIRLSIPAMKEAMQPGLAAVSTTVSEIVKTHQNDMVNRLHEVDAHLKAQDVRLGKLEGMAKWAIGAAAATGVFLTAIFETVRWYFFSKNNP